MVKVKSSGLLGLALVLPGCASGDPGPGPPGEDVPLTIRLESAAFGEGGTIPRAYTCDGENVSPPLSWSGVPASARALVLIADDPDAPRGTWTHWVLYDLPAEAGALPERLPPEATVEVPSGEASHVARQGRNDFRKLGYGGPCPPSGTHRYDFRLYALDAPTGLEPGATRREVLDAIDGHVLARGQLMGRYARGG
jgi:Raf kinase inhibitor-like YbhB/YbcL family protein